MCVGLSWVDSKLAQLTSFYRKAGPVQKFVEAFGDSFAVGATAIVVEEDDRGIFFALVRGGDPIPGAAAGGGKAKARTEIFLVGQIVERFEVQRLETIDLPVFRPPAVVAGLFDLETGSLNSGFVIVQAEKSFWQEFAQFAFDGVRLRVQQAAEVGIVSGFDLIGGGAGTESRNGTADTCRDNEQRSGEGERAEDKEDKFVHALMILHGSSEDGTDRPLRKGSTRGIA